MLRGVARDRAPVRVVLGDGTPVDGTIDVVGADYLESRSTGRRAAAPGQRVTTVSLVPYACSPVVRHVRPSLPTDDRPAVTPRPAAEGEPRRTGVVSAYIRSM